MILLSSLAAYGGVVQPDQLLSYLINSKAQYPQNIRLSPTFVVKLQVTDKLYIYKQTLWLINILLQLRGCAKGCRDYYSPWEVLESGTRLFAGMQNPRIEKLLNQVGGKGVMVMHPKISWGVLHIYKTHEVFTISGSSTKQLNYELLNLLSTVGRGRVS